MYVTVKGPLTQIPLFPPLTKGDQGGFPEYENVEGIEPAGERHRNRGTHPTQATGPAGTYQKFLPSAKRRRPESSPSV